MPDPCFDFLLPTVHAFCIPALCLCRVSQSVQWNAVVRQAVKASAPPGRSWVLELRDCRQPHSALLNAGSRDHALSHVGLLTALSLAQHGCAAGGVCKAFSRTAVRCTSRRRRPCGMPHSRGRGLLRARSAILCSQEHHQLPRYLQQMPQSPKGCPSAGCQLQARLWPRIACDVVVYVRVQLLGLCQFDWHGKQLCSSQRRRRDTSSTGTATICHHCTTQCALWVMSGPSQPRP